jgi:hypothetical protein
VQNVQNEITGAVVRMSPPAAVAAWNYVLGMPIEKWVSVATLIYILLQAYFLLKDRLRKRRERRSER